MQNEILALNFYRDRYGDLTETILQENSYSQLASARLQLIPALNAAKSIGMQAKSLSLSTEYPEYLECLGLPKICLVGKMIGDDIKCNVANLSAVARMKRMGIPIIVLYSNHHLNKKDERGEFYRDLLFLADHVVCPTSSLKQLAQSSSRSGLHFHVIEDPWQIKSLEDYRELKKNSPIKIIWFGAALNLCYLHQKLLDIGQSKFEACDIELTVFTATKAVNYFKNFLKENPDIYPKWNYRFVEWNGYMQPKQFNEELARAHISLIPSNPNDPEKQGASHNRLVDSIRAGCICIASPLPSYKELNSLSLLGENFGLMLHSAIENYNQLSSRYKSLREDILLPFSPNANEKKWAQLLSNILN